MIRRVIQIDETLCDGCGLCVKACHEGAIALVDGKARLTRDDYCDGLGDCLPACPADAITFIEREAAPYDATAVAQAKGEPVQEEPASQTVHGTTNEPSALAQWPCQIKLIPVQAPYFEDAHVLIAADCCAFAYAQFHRDFMQEKITLVGCPKLDGVDYASKLAEIFSSNDIASVTVARMEVPCCGGLEFAARRALQACGKTIPCQVATISCRGQLLGIAEASNE